MKKGMIHALEGRGVTGLDALDVSTLELKTIKVFFMSNTQFIHSHLKIGDSWLSVRITAHRVRLIFKIMSRSTPRSKKNTKI